jgi:hypothetical protein
MENIDTPLKEHGCFFAEYAGQMRPIFYMKYTVFSKLFDCYEQKKHKIFEQIENDDKPDNIYILKIEDMGLPFIPVEKDVVEQMISEGELLENINIDSFVEKHNKNFPYITKENMEKLVHLLQNELTKTDIDLKYHEFKQSCMDDDNESSSDSDSSSNSDNNNNNKN